jgi:hypothetical protein
MPKPDQRSVRRGLVLAALPVVIGLATLVPAPACAQTFFPRTFTGTKTVTLSISANELVRDRWSGSQRYARSLAHHRTILGSAALRSITFTPTQMDIRTEVTGGVSDRVEVGWGDLPPSASRNGTSMLGMSVSASTTPYVRTLQFPGAFLRFRTNRDLQAAGWTFGSVTVTSGSPVFSELTIQPYDRITALLMDTDDLIDMRLQGRSDGTVTLALWPYQRTHDIVLWARCNALPTGSAFDFRAATANPGGYGRPVVMELPRGQCAQGTWFVTITSVAPTPMMVNMTVGLHNPDRVRNLKVGVAFAATATQMTTIRQVLEDAAWHLYGATMGASLVRRYDVYGTSACDDGWPYDEYACGGGGCDICIQDEVGGSNCNAEGRNRIDLYGDDWFGNTLAHEMGHCPLDMRDEYTVPADSCPFTGARAMDLCGRTIMGQYRVDNIHSLCTAITHRTVGENCSPAPTGCVAIPGPDSFECNGHRNWTNEPAGWDDLYSSGAVVVTHPTWRDPDNHDYQNYTTTTDIFGQAIIH